MLQPPRASLPALLLLIGAVACDSGPQTAAEPPPSKPGPELVPVLTEGRVDTIVRAELARAKRDHRKLVIYVGGQWSEPCKQFEQMVASGALRDEFPDLRLLKFDSEDEPRLRAANYFFQVLPTFAIPAENGRGTDQIYPTPVQSEKGSPDALVALRSLLGKSAPR